jgi:16S rRNA (cytosine1402-N4)-methyltransferase
MTANPAPDALHIPVMLDPVIAHLAPRAGETHIDGTFGRGGYTRAILSTGARVIAIDRDPAAISAAHALTATVGDQLRVVEGRFSALDDHASDLGVPAVDGVVLDVGVSSVQLDQAERGFSFRFDGPLDMRMSRSGPTAADVVNSYEERDLARIFWLFGEEKRANALARAIVTDRVATPFLTTRALADLCGRVVGRPGRDDIHPATRAFQALRIYVNGELDELADALAAAERALSEGGRLVVVTFHSLEDRIVKRFLAERTQDKPAGSRHAPITAVPDPTFRPLTRGVLNASDAECRLNPRARSAKLRAAQRTAAPARPIDRTSLGVPVLHERTRRA